MSKASNMLGQTTTCSRALNPGILIFWTLTTFTVGVFQSIYLTWSQEWKEALTMFVALSLTTAVVLNKSEQAFKLLKRLVS